jgi:diadenosine tetraphosphate (Ap4A) HIT family hydrolase
MVVNRVKNILEQKHQPDGFNVGVNDDEKPGETINHALIHLTPRKKGDIEKPKEGITQILPTFRYFLIFNIIF